MASNVDYTLGAELFVYYSDSSVATVGDTPFAYSTECTLSISADQIDTSNKQSGIWASALPGQLSWNVSTSALYTSANNYHAIFKLFADRTPVVITFGHITSLGTADADASLNLNTGKAYYSGKAYITSLELNAGSNEVASFSVEFTGEGKLTQSGYSA